MQLQYVWKLLAVVITAVLLHLGAETGMHALVTVLLAVRLLFMVDQTKGDCSSESRDRHARPGHCLAGSKAFIDGGSNKRGFFI